MEKEKVQSKNAFNKQALGYDNAPVGRMTSKAIPVILRSLENIKFANVLDLGCGTGTLLQDIKELYPDIELNGVDISENMVKIANEKLGEGDICKVGDVENLNFMDNTFDLVTCSYSFHHYPNPEAVVKEIYRVIKPGGRFILVDQWHSGLGRMIFNMFIGLSRDGDVHIYSEKEYYQLFKQYFQEVKWNSINGSSCILICGK
jgi:ubiquinone/menaquinone biosynthesis C-methylase UbiE